jgi:hypothetical protein
VIIVFAVVIAGGLALYRQRHIFFTTLDRVGTGAVLAGFLFGATGTMATYPAWRQVLAGLDVRLPWRAGAQVFFISQLGKYLPGSIWPVLMQMEAGRSRGAERRTMIAANLVTIVLSCSAGLVVACALLPLHDASALTRYGWALAVLPLLLALLHPRAVPAILDRVFVLLHRPALHCRLAVGNELRASFWSLISWAGLGLQVTVLCVALGHRGMSVLLLCTGGMALAYVVGLLFLPAPAGAGVRDAVLIVVLEPTLPFGQALIVAVASRVMLAASDVGLALASMLLRLSRPRL